MSVYIDIQLAQANFLWLSLEYENTHILEGILNIQWCFWAVYNISTVCVCATILMALLLETDSKLRQVTATALLKVDFGSQSRVPNFYSTVDFC